MFIVPSLTAWVLKQSCVIFIGERKENGTTVLVKLLLLLQVPPLLTTTVLLLILSGLFYIASVSKKGWQGVQKP